jgi:hypothetical protein
MEKIRKIPSIVKTESLIARAVDWLRSRQGI